VRLVNLVFSGIAAAALSTGAIAADVTYSFSTGAVLDHGGTNDTNQATQPASQQIADSIAAQLFGSSVSGSIVYDASSAVTNSGGAFNGLGDVYGGMQLPNGSFHSSLNAFSGLVSGSSSGSLTFTDPRGSTVVGNDGFLLGCAPPCTPSLVDFFGFNADPGQDSFTPHNLTGFSVTVPSGQTYRLYNARFFWIEGQPATTPNGDFLTSNALLATPPTFYGTLALDFVNAANPSNATGIQYDVFYNGVTMTAAVPEPETYAMLVAGFGLLGFIARRRKKLAS
jgi:hypothetical protein